MTATTQTPGAPTAAQHSAVVARPMPQGENRLRAWHVLRSEWIKLWSVRSTPTMMIVIVAVMIGFGAMAAGVSTGEVSRPNGGGGGGPTDFAHHPLAVAMVGANFAVLLIGTLGALVGAREFSSGMIRTTVAAVPRRIGVLGAKALTLTVALIPVVVVGVLGAFAVAMSILSGAGATTVTLGAAGWALVGTMAYLLGVGLLGLSLGFLFRSIAGSIATLIGGLLILPGIIGALLPASWSEVLKYLPSNAASSFTEITPPADMLGVGAGVAVFVAWLVVMIGAAGYVFRRRDV